MRSLFLLLLTVVSSFGYQQFEARHRHPIDMTPNGAHLLALNSPASSLSVFAVGNASQTAPLLIAEIPVGTEPVTVRARTNDEVWVVNEVSDSISVVSISKRLVIATLRVADEPADVCFAAGKAFVSCARNRQLQVFDPLLLISQGTISLNGLYPRALVASADGTKLYVASLLSGNGTTILKEQSAPAQPAPTNTTLPAAPKTALIVPATDSRINWTTLDQDIAEINTSTNTVIRWFSGMGTNLFDLARHPDGTIWCANSDSLNLTRFEPELRGRFVDHRLTKVNPATSAITHHNLNPGIARATTPAPASIALGLAQPTAIVFNADGSRAWTAAFNSDRVAEIDTTSGAILRRVDVRIPPSDAKAMRGPRGLQLSLDGTKLFVLNKISDTLTTIEISSGNVLGEVPLGSIDPMPVNVRQGRGFLYDARLSGNGTMSCATCHLDADHDGLAWDLGDPGGSMISVASADLSFHDNTVFNRDLHPMKGPMVTQTLRGLMLNPSPVTTPAAAVVTKFHWRGDRPTIQSFNTTFPNLMGGTQIPAADMDLMAIYLQSLIHHPNPNRNMDRTLKTSVNGGDAVAGRDLYNTHLKSHCIVCHGYSGGTDQNLDSPSEVDRRQPIKNPHLRLVYQRSGIFNPTAGQTSLSGFGLGSDGTRFLLPKVHPYALDQLTTPKEQADVAAFVLSFDTGTAPVVGYDVTVTPPSASASQTATDLALLEARAATGEAGLVATGNIAGRHRSFRWNTTTQRYLSDSSADAPLTRAQLLAMLTTTDALNFSGVLPEQTARLGGDRDGDGILDQDELLPAITLTKEPAALRLKWPAGYDDWFPEGASTLNGPWSPWADAILRQPLESNAVIPSPLLPRNFYRLRRTW